MLTAYKLIEILEEAGLPKGVVNFVPGDPKDIGDYLVDSVHTHFVTFTGLVQQEHAFTSVVQLYKKVKLS